MKTPEKVYVTQHVPSYTVYYQDQKARLSSKYPFLSADQINCKIRDQWKNMKTKDRKSFTLPKLCLTPTRKSSTKKKIQNSQSMSEERKKSSAQNKLFTEIGTEKKQDITSLPSRTSNVFKQISVADWLTRENKDKKMLKKTFSMAELRRKMEVPVVAVKTPEVLDRTPHLTAGILQTKDRSTSLNKMKQDGKVSFTLVEQSVKCPEPRRLLYDHDNIDDDNIDDQEENKREEYSDSDDDNLLHYRQDNDEEDEIDENSYDSHKISQEHKLTEYPWEEIGPEPNKSLKSGFAVPRDTRRTLRPRKRNSYVEDDMDQCPTFRDSDISPGKFTLNTNKGEKYHTKTSPTNFKNIHDDTNMEDEKNSKALTKKDSKVQRKKSVKKRKTIPGLFDEYEIEVKSDEEVIKSQDRLIEEFYLLHNEDIYNDPIFKGVERKKTYENKKSLNIQKIKNVTTKSEVMNEKNSKTNTTEPEGLGLNGIEEIDSTGDMRDNAEPTSSPDKENTVTSNKGKVKQKSKTVTNRQKNSITFLNQKKVEKKTKTENEAPVEKRKTKSARDKSAPPLSTRLQENVIVNNNNNRNQDRDDEMDFMNGNLNNNNNVNTKENLHMDKLDGLKYDEDESLDVPDLKMLTRPIRRKSFVKPDSFSTSYDEDENEEDDVEMEEEDDNVTGEVCTDNNTTLQNVLRRLQQIGSQSSPLLPVEDESPKLLSPTLSGVSMLSSLSEHETNNKPKNEQEKQIITEPNNSKQRECRKRPHEVSGMFQDISPQHKKTKQRWLCSSNKKSSKFDVLSREEDIFL